MWLRVGDEHGRWQVHEIDKETLVLQVNDEINAIELYEAMGH